MFVWRFVLVIHGDELIGRNRFDTRNLLRKLREPIVNAAMIIAGSALFTVLFSELAYRSCVRGRRAGF